MRIAVLMCCLALAVADRSTSKRGIGAEAFARPLSQDTGSAFNLQAIVAANQLAPQSYADPSQQFIAEYQPEFLGQHEGFGLSGIGGGYSRIPLQHAPQQKPAQLALAAAAAVAQQNFGHPAYGAPPRQDPQAAIQQNVNNQLYTQQPQYREYNQQLQNYVSQPIALNFGNTRINTFPPPTARPGSQAPNTFQAYGQGQQAPLGQAYGQGQQAPLGQAYYASVQQSQDLFQPAPAQVQPELPQPTAIPYASPQIGIQYSAPQSLGLQYAPSYGLQSDKGSPGAYSYASFASGGQVTTASGFRPIIP